jgi:hypothetical protein
VKRFVFCVGIAALLLSAAPRARGQGATAVAPPRVASSVDRTAMWVADRISFTVEIDCAPGVDILPDDVAREKLRLNGLEAVSSDVSTTADATDRKVYRIKYLLTTYRVDNPSPSIETMNVRYYARRPGERIQDVAPAGEVQVPGAVLAFRSTLPENQTELAVRDGRAPLPRQAFFARTAQLGLALIVVSAAPVLVIAAAAMRRRTAGRPARRSARQVKQDRRAMLDRLRAMDVSSEEDRRRACNEISAAVRGYVAAHAHVPAAALTPTEVDAALAGASFDSRRSLRSGGRVPRETVVSLLTRCDEARYAPHAAVMSAEACRDALTTAEQLLSGH